jgi:7,8-dihydropterin-6-yl-methyl-4-(beta-D-ribofuranosyl)aminobenzene 5'-phosphate synthase
MVRTLNMRVLVEDTVRRTSTLIAKHGLAFKIDVDVDSSQRVQMMLDAGPSAEVLAHNLAATDVDLQHVDHIVLSHGHYDHTGGLLRALAETESPTLVLAHPNAFKPKLKLKPTLTSIGSPFTVADIKAAGGVSVLSKSPLPVADGVSTSGEIDRGTPFEEVMGFWTVEDDRLVKDLMLDDQALYLNIEDKGLVVITGCAHAGIINTIKQGQRVLALEEVYAVIGGFHLKDASDERITATIEELVALNPEIVAPCHCTGSTAVKRLRKAFRRRCRILRTGDRLALSA